MACWNDLPFELRSYIYVLRCRINFYDAYLFMTDQENDDVWGDLPSFCNWCNQTFSVFCCGIRYLFHYELQYIIGTVGGTSLVADDDPLPIRKQVELYAIYIFYRPQPELSELGYLYVPSKPLRKLGFLSLKPFLSVSVYKPMMIPLNIQCVYD